MSIKDGDRLPHRRILTGSDLMKCGDREREKGYNGFMKLEAVEEIVMREISKYIIGIGGLAVAGLGIYLGLPKEPSKYSFEWIKKLTDKDWEIEREIVRQNMLNPKYDESKRINFQKLLDVFDKVKSDRDWAGKKPQGPAYHREHGFNLYKP